jgi:hypothetical protein
MNKKTSMRKIIYIATFILINTVNVSYSQTEFKNPRDIADFNNEKKTIKWH